MTAAAQLFRSSAQPNLRPFDLRRDLFAVADLVELCFADRLDDDGHRFIKQMRAAANNMKRIGLAVPGINSFPMSMVGFVWWEDDELVGNLSLLPVSAMKERAYLIANVSVHPEYRRRGIARALTEAALAYIRKRNVKWSWLQVDDDNPAALILYENSGFTEQARRTTWQCNSPQETQIKQLSHDISITSRRAKDWASQQTWLSQTYPSAISWHLSLRQSLLRAGMRGSLTRLFNGKRVRQWSARRSNKLLGVLSWQSSTAQADKLWLAAPPEFEETAIQALLLRARRVSSPQRSLALDFPSGRAVNAIQKAGFYNHQTLVWMKREV
jgi:ribosomal protein S18 acetylase RimI-like enzyme